MEYFEIIGGKKLKGEIEVRGSKNATTPILAATLLTKNKCVVSNIPLIEDVFRMIEIIESLGAKVSWKGERTVEIEARNIDASKLDLKAVKRLRSSILLLGALSGRLDNFKIPYPGGCAIGARPLDTHFDALRKMGIRTKESKIKIDGKESGCYLIDASKRKNAEIVLKEFSVTGTENAMMLAANVPGKTVIKIAAQEPHVEDLAVFLVKMGAKIKGLTLQFLPFSEIAKLDTVERIKKLLKIILDNKVIVLQGRLKPEEETRLIEDTMIMVGRLKGFKGVELAVISQDNGNKSVVDKMRFGLARALVGQQDALTIIGPATIVKEMKKDPKKLEVMMR